MELRKLNNKRVVILGGAGLVGQNLVTKILEHENAQILVIDKSHSNLEVLSALHPTVETIHADLSTEGDWSNSLSSDDVIVMLQAQIGGIKFSEFENNNILSTQLVLETMKTKGIRRLIHVSSSVVNSVADDWYTQTKESQEKLVVESDTDFVVLRPTLMFGWFDRKHLGWLSRFMKKVPIFPIPGSGKYMRQPLYAGDFANVIVSCISDVNRRGVYEITGQEQVDYIDIIRTIKRAIQARCLIVRIPFTLFKGLIATWSVFDRNPPFTTQQLKALVAEDEFEVTNWPEIFGVSPTKFDDAIRETFSHPVYSSIVLEF